MPDPRQVWLPAHRRRTQALRIKILGPGPKIAIDPGYGLPEAEVREILASAVKPEARVRIGDALVALGRKIGLTNEDFEIFNQVRDETPAEPLGFE